MDFSLDAARLDQFLVNIQECISAQEDWYYARPLTAVVNELEAQCLAAINDVFEGDRMLIAEKWICDFDFDLDGPSDESCFVVSHGSPR